MDRLSWLRMFISSWLKLKSHNEDHDFSFEIVNLGGGKRGYRNGNNRFNNLIAIISSLSERLILLFFDETDRERLLLLTTVFTY